MGTRVCAANEDAEQDIKGMKLSSALQLGCMDILPYFSTISQREQHLLPGPSCSKLMTSLLNNM